MAEKTIALGLIGLACLAAVGCNGTTPPIVTPAPLGKVIVYRNGVAYFERYATIQEDTLTIRVPGERVDDFLKSLTIVDEQSGKALPISYPTMEADGGEVEMTITIPKKHGRLRIAYVTESPAWKPTYRIVLGEGDGPAKLHGWAVVDNVSGEDWNRVKIGVGSTSALSFRYDLHSVRLVERQTLSSHSPLALAPPTGGSPYAVAGKKLRIVGNLTDSELADIDGRELEEEIMADMAPPADGNDDDGDYQFRAQQQTRGGAYRGQGARRRSGRRIMTSVANRLKNSGEQIVIEGYAQRGDNDPRQASLDRANRLKDKLISEGVPEGQIAAVGTGTFNAREAVRVVATDEQSKQAARLAKLPKAADQAAGIEDQPLGTAHFESPKPMTILEDHSAMVSILNAEAQAERVYFYDPISDRGSKQFAFSAIRLKNPSSYMLDSGPFTVYTGNQFLGEGLSDPILPGAQAFIPYALDRSIVADPKVNTREEIERLVTIQRGIVTTETRRIRKTTLTLTNRNTAPAKVFVRYTTAPGYTLEKAKHKIEKFGGAYLLPVEVPASEALKLVIEEWTPIAKTVDIRTDGGVRAIAMFLRVRKIEAELQRKLQEIIDSHKAMSDLQERIDVLAEQMGVYRTRVDEINVQLVTLRKVPQAGKLRRHLTVKMQQISERLQQATMQLADMKGQKMTLKIELQDKLADLTLKDKKAEEAEEEPDSS